jgi:outer membrane protein OmpA-like peptidoglycan-associated protein
VPETTAGPSDPVTSHKITILFRFDRSDAAGSDLTTKREQLEGVATLLRNDPDLQAEIHGHADSNGPLGYNMALSRKRAHTVRDFFVSQWKLDKKRFRIFAHGAKRPAASNATPHGRAKNRRVIVLLIP